MSSPSWVDLLSGDTTEPFLSLFDVVIRWNWSLPSSPNTPVILQPIYDNAVRGFLGTLKGLWTQAASVNPKNVPSPTTLGDQAMSQPAVSSLFGSQAVVQLVMWVTNLCAMFYEGHRSQYALVTMLAYSKVAANNPVMKNFEGTFGSSGTNLITRDSIMQWLRTSLYSMSPFTACGILFLDDVDVNPNSWQTRGPQEARNSHGFSMIRVAGVRNLVLTFIVVNEGSDNRDSSLLPALNDPGASPVQAGQDGNIQYAKVLIEALARLSCIAPSIDLVLPTLMAGYVSGYHIASVNETTFVSNVNREPGADSGLLTQLHKRSVAVSLRAESSLMNLADYVRGTGLSVLDGGETALTRTVRVDAYMKNAGLGLTVDSLIGETDNFACADCKSVSGAAAYLTEILQFLPEDARAYLFVRRPDILSLGLTCENTDVELPHIDLANEIMESWITHTTDNLQTSSGDDSLDLIAEPKQILSTVYTDTLKQAWFSLSKLPYNFYLDKIRLLLKSLKTSRYDLLILFRDESRSTQVAYEVDVSGNHTNINAAWPTQPSVVDRAADAEYLGLSHADFIAITKKSFWPEFSFGVPTGHELWGYKSLADLQSEDGTKPPN